MKKSASWRRDIRNGESNAITFNSSEWPFGDLGHSLEGKLPAHVYQAVEWFARTARIELRHLCCKVLHCYYGTHCVGHCGY
jgi:hypothetical protein